MNFFDDVDVTDFDDHKDYNGKPPKYLKGEWAYLKPIKEYVIVIEQIKHWDCDEWFFGNCKIWFEDGNIGSCNSWQLEKLYEIH